MARPDSMACGRRRRIGQRGRDAHHLLAGRGVTVLAGVEQRQRAARQHDHRDHQRSAGRSPGRPASAATTCASHLRSIRPRERNELKRDLGHAVANTILADHIRVDVRRTGETAMTDQLGHRRPRRKKRDRTHWLYIAVIVAVVAGVAVGLLAPDVGKSVGVLGTMFVSLIKMMIVARHLLHDRAGHRLGARGRHRRQGRRSGVRLLPGDVDGRAGDRPGRRQPAQPGQRPATLGERVAARAPSWPRPAHEAGGLMDFVQHIIPTSLLSSLTEGNVLQALFVALLVGFALQAMGTRGRADPARHRAPAEAGVQGPGDDPVAGPDRCVRRDRQRRRADRLDAP